MGPGAIPVADVLAWLDLHEIDDSESRVDYYELIIELDSVWMKKITKKSKEIAEQQDADRRKNSAGHR